MLFRRVIVLTTKFSCSNLNYFMSLQTNLKIKIKCESIFLFYDPRFSKEHCLLEGSQTSPVCVSGKSIVWSIGGMILTGENRSTQRKTCPTATYPIQTSMDRPGIAPASSVFMEITMRNSFCTSQSTNRALTNWHCLIIAVCSEQHTRHPNALWEQRVGFNLRTTHVFCRASGLLTLNLLTTTIVAFPSNASKRQMGFNSAFKGLSRTLVPFPRTCAFHRLLTTLDNVLGNSTRSSFEVRSGATQ